MSDEDHNFGFRVEKDDRDDFGEKLATPVWKVSLPHKCDRWRIDNDTMYLEGSFQEEAVEELETFIKQAQEALEALKRGEEFGSD